MSAAPTQTAKLPTGRDRTASWYEASARTRVRLLLDAGSFLEFIGPEMREVSPHLQVFDLPEQFDDGIVVGRGSLDGSPVFIAAQEGHFMGGAFGEVHGAKLTGLLRAARDIKSIPVLILFDTGGVRLQEANAGELAVAEIMRAVIEARSAGVKVIGLIGGRSGCYGGGGPSRVVSPCPVRRSLRPIVASRSSTPTTGPWCGAPWVASTGDFSAVPMLSSTTPCRIFVTPHCSCFVRPATSASTR